MELKDGLFSAWLMMWKEVYWGSSWRKRGQASLVSIERYKAFYLHQLRKGEKQCNVKNWGFNRGVEREEATRSQGG